MKIYLLLPFLILYIMLTFFCPGQLERCYSSDGSPSTDFPCDSLANVSSCCGGGSYCVTNFYCIDAEGWRNVYRRYMARQCMSPPIRFVVRAPCTRKGFALIEPIQNTGSVASTSLSIPPTVVTGRIAPTWTLRPAVTTNKD